MCTLYVRASCVSKQLSQLWFSKGVYFFRKGNLELCGTFRLGSCIDRLGMKRRIKIRRWKHPASAHCPNTPLNGLLSNTNGCETPNANPLALDETQSSQPTTTTPNVPTLIAKKALAWPKSVKAGVRTKSRVAAKFEIRAVGKSSSSFAMARILQDAGQTLW